MNRQYSAFFWGFMAIGGVIASYLPVSYIIGSHWQFFSLKAVFVPLIGLYGGVFASALLFLLRSSFGYFVYTKTIFSLLIHTVPGLSAAIYWQQSSFIRSLIPLLCIIIFWAHPVGLAAAFYALYWFIPVVVQVSKTNSLFFHALSATFTAHAVGSVIWIYSMPMIVQDYVTLMSLVLFERIFFATGITLISYVINYLYSQLKVYVQQSIVMIREGA